MGGFYADEGTAAHQVLEECLRMTYEVGLTVPASAYVGSTLRVEDGPHGRLSPSGAKRWMTCPGAPEMETQFPESPSPPREIEVTAEMAEAVQVCLAYVEERVEDLEENLYPHADSILVIPERRVSLRSMLDTDECDGTSDITIQVWKDGHLLHAEQIDYKHGRGVPVSVDDPQNDLYLLGTLAMDVPGDECLPGTAQVAIVQPRCDKVSPRIRERPIECVEEWLGGFRTAARQAIAATREESPKLVASEDGCRFCNANGACSEYTRFALAGAGVIAEDDAPPETAAAMVNAAIEFGKRDHRVLTPDQLVGILRSKDVLTGALQAIEAYAQQMLIEDTAPQTVRNAFKLVRGRATRRWANDEVETFRLLKKIKGTDPETGKQRALGKKDLYVTRFVTAPQAEKRLKAMHVAGSGLDAFRRLIDKPEGPLTIAPMSDPRKAVEPTPKPTPEDAFADAPPAPGEAE